MALAKATNQVIDGNTTEITVITMTDGTNNGPCHGTLGNDGTHFQPSMDTPARPGFVAPVASASGGATAASFIADGTAYQHVIKASPGTLYTFSASNNGSGNLFLRLYDKASNATPGTDTPIKRVVIPPGGREVQIPAVGVSTAAGIAFVFTAGSLLDNDVTPVVVGTGAVDWSFQ